MATLSDERIAELLALPKVVTRPKQSTKIQRKSACTNYPVESLDGRLSFELYTRQNQLDPEHYSCGLIYQPGGGNKGITLVRYNGSNHTHSNPLEGGALIINQCHIHRATERYMAAGDKGDKYAETTNRYSTMDEALACLLEDCSISGLSIDLPAAENPNQIDLFND